SAELNSCSATPVKAMGQRKAKQLTADGPVQHIHNRSPPNARDCFLSVLFYIPKPLLCNQP
ncbi:MAG: hypothetical protein ACFNWW_08230, partial [Negativicutes bacterium]